MPPVLPRRGSTSDVSAVDVRVNPAWAVVMTGMCSDWRRVQDVTVNVLDMIAMAGKLIAVRCALDEISTPAITDVREGREISVSSALDERIMLEAERKAGSCRLDIAVLLEMNKYVISVSADRETDCATASSDRLTKN